MKAKQIKCYCGHTTYCDCGPLEEARKQTAVEWLVEQIKSDKYQKALSLSEWIKVFDQAKEMEKERSHAEYMRGWKDGLTKQEQK